MSFDYYDSLPDWDEIERKRENKEELDPVEQFIYDNEPAGFEDEQVFRKSFQKALYFFGGISKNL